MDIPESSSTRRRANSLVEDAAEEGLTTIDLGEMEFISGGVADELLVTADECDLTLRVRQGSPVAKMLRGYTDLREENGSPPLRHVLEVVEDDQ